jgi:hypothetical protein
MDLVPNDISSRVNNRFRIGIILACFVLRPDLIGRALDEEETYWPTLSPSCHRFGLAHKLSQYVQFLAIST